MSKLDLYNSFLSKCELVNEEDFPMDEYFIVHVFDDSEKGIIRLSRASVAENLDIATYIKIDTQEQLSDTSTKLTTEYRKTFDLTKEICKLLGSV